jgi:hypothetical protein
MEELTTRVALCLLTNAPDAPQTSLSLSTKQAWIPDSASKTSTRG